MAPRWFIIALAAVAIAAATTEAATTHVVGGSTGWTIPSSPSFYSQWASAQNFKAGDTLVFNFTAGIHNVMEVPKSSYDSCSQNKKIGPTLTIAPATVTVTKPGRHYYICGVTGHCSIGQKLAINVAPAASSSSPAPAPSGGSPAPGPSADAPAPARAADAPAPGPSAGTPAAAPAADAPAAATPAPSSSAPAAAPTAASPAGPQAPAGSSSSGPSAGPTSSNTSDTQNPTAVAGPADGGPAASSATSLSLSSGYLRSMGVAAILSAAVAFLL